MSGRPRVTGREEVRATDDRAVAKQIHVYLSGPMRGHPLYNFPAFEFAHWAIKRKHPRWFIHNPALKDRMDGFDPSRDTPTEDQIASWMRRDIGDISRSQIIVMLPNWETSVGARRELQCAIWCSLRLAWFDPAAENIRPLSYQTAQTILDNGLQEKML